MNNTKRITKIALFPALMGATSGIVIPLLHLPPITLQTFFVVLAGLLLKPKEAIMSMGLYLVLGFIGLPVFSGFTSGVGVLIGPSGGFLIAFPLIAWIISYFSTKWNKSENRIHRLVFLFGSILVLYMIGAAYISLLYKISLVAVLVGFVPYLPGDVMKVFSAIIVYERVKDTV